MVGRGLGRRPLARREEPVEQRLGAGTTVGVGSHVEIGVETGEKCQIGSLSVGPKYSKLEGHATWVGIPVHRLAVPQPVEPPV